MLTSDRTYRFNNSTIIQLLLLLLCILFQAAYYVIRYDGRWGETDTASLTNLIRVMSNESTLISNDVYSQGYGYPFFAHLITSLSDIEVSTFQLLLAPFLSIWIVVPAWLLYREFTGSITGATLATIIIFTQPEFLFVILRSSHEKISRGLMFFCLYLFIRSFRSRNKLANFGIFIILFYISLYGLIATSAFITFTFISAIGITLTLLWFTTALNVSNLHKNVISRLVVVVLASLVLIFIFVFIIYQPAQYNLYVLKSITERSAALILDVDISSTNPYEVINLGWINSYVYIILSISNWILLLGSLTIWLSQTYKVVIQRTKFANEKQALLWAFLGGFGLIGLLTIVADLSGAIGGNLQLRTFPSYSMLASPVVAGWLIETRPNTKVNVLRNKYSWTILPLLFIFSTIKATNEPLFSNNWIFYKSSEKYAVQWIDKHAEYSSIWTDFNERLISAYKIEYGNSEHANIFDAFIPKSNTNLYIVSDLIKQRGSRLQNILPVQFDSLRIFDNGESAIYRSRPLTAYQK